MDDNKSLLIMSESTDSVKALIERVGGFGYSLIHATTPDAFDEIDAQHFPKLALIDVNVTNQELAEQIIERAKEAFPELKVIGLYNKPLESDSKTLSNLKVDRVFKAGYEDEFFINTLFEISPIDLEKENLSLELLTRINILELERIENLPFDVYVCLPANKKIIQFANKGQNIDKSRAERFKKNKEYGLYIKKSDSNKYSEFCADQLSKIQNDPNLSDVIKKKAIEKELKELMNGFFSTNQFDDDTGDQLLGNVSRVLFSLKDSSGEKEELMESVTDLIAQNMTSYTHSKNVATYSVLFGMAVGIMEPESLKIGGFLHDLGMADFDNNLIIKDVADLTDKEMAQFRLHPGNAKLTIQMKKLKLPELSMAMIMEHHEHTDGTGFPYGKEGADIHPGGKICAIADEFDHLTSVRFGYKRLTPAEAMKRIAGLDGSEPSPIFDPEFHKPILTLYLADDPAIALLDQGPLPSIEETITEAPAATLAPEELAPQMTAGEVIDSAREMIDEMVSISKSEPPQPGKVTVINEDQMDSPLAQVEPESAPDAPPVPPESILTPSANASIQPPEEELPDSTQEAETPELSPEAQVFPEVVLEKPDFTQIFKPKTQGAVTISILYQSPNYKARDYLPADIDGAEDDLKDKWLEWEQQVKDAFVEEIQKSSSKQAS